MSVMFSLGEVTSLRKLSESSFYSEDITRGAISKKFTKNSVNFVEKVFYDILDFNLKPEKFSDKIKSILGYKDINFENYPKFSSRHLLKG